MAEGEQPPRPNSLKPEEVQQLGDEAVEKMRRRVESRLALDIPQEGISSHMSHLPESVSEPVPPSPVGGEDIHTRLRSSSEVPVSPPVLSSPKAPQGESSARVGKGRRRDGSRDSVPKGISQTAAVVDLAAESQEAANIERLVKEAIAAEAAIAKESSDDPLVDVQVPGGVPPRRRPLDRAPEEATPTPETNGNRERYELHKGDVWVKETSDRTEWLTLQDVAGANVTVRTKFLSKDGRSNGMSGNDMSAKGLIEKLRSEGYVRVLDIDLDALGEQQKVEEPGTYTAFEIEVPPQSEQVNSPEALRQEIEKDEKGYGYDFRVLKNGEEQHYLAGDDTLFIVRKKKDGYYFVNGDGELSGPMTQDAMRHQAEAERWLLIEEGPAAPVKEVKKAALEKEASLSEFYPLQDGERQKYYVPEFKGEVTVEKFPEGYRFYFGAKYDPKDKFALLLSEDEMRRTVKEARWEAREKVSPSEVLASDPFPESERAEDYPFHLLGEGQWTHYRGKGEPITITRKGDKFLVQFMDTKDGKDGDYTLKELVTLARKESWEPLDDRLKELARQATPEKKAGDSEAELLQQKIDALKTEVAEFRYKYAEMDYEKTSAWKTLKGFFRNITPKGQEDADTQYWNSEYRLKLAELQEKELDQIKQSGLKGAALKERMAGVLQYYKYEQAAALYNDRTQVRMERQSFIGKAWGKWEEAVKAYGKLSLSKKVFIGVGLVGASVATGGVGAAGILLLRKAMGVTGLSLATDTLLEGYLDKRGQKKAQKEIKKFEEEYFDDADSELTFQNYSLEIDKEIKKLNEKLQKRKLEALARRLVSSNVGMLGMMGGSVLASHVSEMMHHDISHAAASPTPQHVAPAASAPDAASSAPTGVAEAQPVSPGAHPQEFKVSFGREEVTSADGKRGLWGILDRHLPQDMLPQAEKNRIIQSLENAIQQKLDHMSPAELKEVGFPNGNVNQIYAGTQIDLGKLLTPDEIQSVMEGKDIAASHVEVTAPHRTEVTPRAVGATVEAHGTAPSRLPESIRSTHSAPAPVHEATSSDKLAQQAPKGKLPPVLDTHHTETLVQKNISFTDPKAYLMEHQGDQAVIDRYNGALGRIRMNIFMLKAEHVPVEYDYTLNGEKLGNTKVTQVIRDLAGFERGILSNLDYDRVKNPLHYDQMRDLAQFIEASKKAFGPEFSLVGAGESVDQYTRRMATAALRTGKEIKGFYKP